MITPGNYSLHIYRLNDFSFTFDIQINGVTLDLTDASVYAQIRSAQNEESTKIDDFTCKVDGVAVTNPATTDNEIELSLTDTETEALSAGEYWYDVLVVDSSGVDTTYLQGKVFIHDTVTVKP